MQRLGQVLPAVSRGSLPTSNVVETPAGPPEIFVSLTDQVIPDRVICFRDMMGRPLLRRSLNPDERSHLERRATALRRALIPCQKEQEVDAGAAISRMIAGFMAMTRIDDHVGQSITAAYVHVVKDRPLWAIEVVCSDIRHGRAGLSPSYCPNEPELSVLLAAKIAPYRARLAEVQALLEAKID